MADDSTLVMLTSNSSSGSSFDYDLYEQTDPSQSIILATIFIMISLTGIIGNILVIFAIVLSRKLRTTTNWFVMNLAFADLLTSICTVFYAVDVLSWDISAYWGWIFSIASSVALTCVGVSLTTHALIGFTSWYLITQNHAEFMRLYSNRNLCIMIAFSWLLTLICVTVIYFTGRIYLYAGNCVLGIWIIGHFGVILTVYIKIWRFVAQQEKTMQSRRKSSAKTQSESEISTRTSEKSIVIPLERVVKDTLQAPASLDHSPSEECRTSPSQSCINDAADLPPSKFIERVGSEKYGLTSNTSPAEVHVVVRVHKPAAVDRFKKQINHKLNRKFIIVTKNLFVVLAAFVICFIPFSICLYIPAWSNAGPWLVALLFFNSCINPIIYARRIRVFREVMMCTIRCRLGSIPMPIEPLRRMTHTD